MAKPKLFLSWDQCREAAFVVADGIEKLHKKLRRSGELVTLYAVPNGGIPAALLVAQHLDTSGVCVSLVEDVGTADYFVDDIVDSGTTRSSVLTRAGSQDDATKPASPYRFFSLVNKLDKLTPSVPCDPTSWVSFPWERMARQDGPHDNIKRLLQFIGEDPEREGLKETPARVVRSYQELFGGYEQEPASVMKIFEDGSCDEMVIVRNIEFYSTCEHHMLPFAGRASIAYIPAGKIIGVSKLARLLEIYSRRLQVQERLCTQITTALDEHLQPKGSACVLEAQHFCMVCRGVNKQHSSMITSSLTGAFREPAVRAEFFTLIKD